jgi:hypothetical protein
MSLVAPSKRCRTLPLLIRDSAPDTAPHAPSAATASSLSGDNAASCVLATVAASRPPGDDIASCALAAAATSHPPSDDAATRAPAADANSSPLTPSDIAKHSGSDSKVADAPTAASAALQSARACHGSTIVTAVL